MNNKTNMKMILSAIIVFFFTNSLSCVQFFKLRRINNPLDCSSDVEVTIGSFLSFKVGADSKLRESILFDLTDSSSNNTTFNGLNTQGVPSKPNIVLGVSDIGRPSFVDIAISSNSGKIIITATATPLANTSGDTIPHSKIKTNSQLGKITHPEINSNTSTEITCTSFTNVLNCVTQKTDFWQYYYINDTSPPAGTYKSTVTYKASSP